MSIARRTSRRRSTPPRDYSQAFFVSPGILGTGRPIPRVLYKYWNEHFASPLDNVSVNSRNCRYPFRDGNIWCPNPSGNIPPAYDGLAKCDYALPEPLATSLMNTITSSELFMNGTLFAIPLINISSSQSYFVQLTRDQLREFGGEFYPWETIETVLSHIPGGQSSIKLLGASVKPSNSVILHVDLDNTIAPSD